MEGRNSRTSESLINARRPGFPANARVPGSRRAVSRLAMALLPGVVAGFVASRWSSPSVAIVAGWNTGALVLLVLQWKLILVNGPADTRLRASATDPGRTVVYSVVVTACALGLFAATVLARQAKHVAPDESGELTGLCLGAVVLAWALTHTLFTLRYAHLYYRDDDEGIGGLDFPGSSAPADSDFAYFAFTIGMCFQVSDVTVTSPTVRRTVLTHALLAFVYNTAILALALNLAFGMFG